MPFNTNLEDGVAKTNSNGDDFYTSAELVGLLMISHQALHQWREARTGPPFFKRAGRYFYPRKGVSEWLMKHERRAVYIYKPRKTESPGARSDRAE